MSDTRTIHTGIYSNRANELISEIVTGLQNYYGTKKTKKTKKMASLLISKVQRGIDNEILITSTAGTYWSRNKRLWNGLTDNQVLRHIIWLYKCLIIKRAGKDSWKRSCTAPIPMSPMSYHDSRDFKISEVYFLYDMFHQRKNFKRSFPKNYSDELIGIPLDPITVELKNAQLEEIKKIEDELQQKCDMLNNQLYTERDAAYNYKAIDAKYKQLETEARSEAAAKIQKIKDEMANITSINLLANIS